MGSSSRTNRINTRRSSSKKKYFVLVGILILLAAGGVWAWHVHRDHTATGKINAAHDHDASAGAASGAKSPSNTPGASSTAQGGAVDENGKQTAPQPPQSQWSTATSGDISLHVPLKNTAVHSGDQIDGTATVSTVQFRLVDNTLGVIAQGPLNVVDGQFSGTLKFQAQSSGGSLDVFSYDPTSGAEINEIQIPVLFNQ